MRTSRNNMISSVSVLAALAAGASAKGVWTTPHDSYSSSIGVLGCKIDTNRVAYWPGSVDCNNLCVKLSYQGRSVHLLRIDQSGGAYDISYDAWAYLQTGKPASSDPITGGPVAMEYEEVDASECASLIHTDGSKLPLSASNSIDFLASCLAQPDSWVAKNYVLYNICDAICSLGFDETCHLDLDVSNQPSCPHTLGLTTPLDGAPVYNVQYQSGKTVVAGSGAPAPASASDEGDEEDGGDGGQSDAANQPAPSPSASAAAAPSPSTYQPAPAAASPSTAAPSPSVAAASPGVFVQVHTDSSVAAPSSSAAPASYPAAMPSSSAAEEATYTTEAPASTSKTAAPSYGAQTGSSTGGGSVYPTGTKASTTFSRATVSGTGATGSVPSSTPSLVTVSAGNAAAPVSALLLLSGFVLSSLLGFF